MKTRVFLYGYFGGVCYRYHRAKRHIDCDFFRNTVGAYNLSIHRKLRVL